MMSTSVNVLGVEIPLVLASFLALVFLAFLLFYSVRGTICTLHDLDDHKRVVLI